MCLFVLSRNENNNGFDLGGLDFFFLEYRCVVFSSFCCCILYRLSGCLFSDMMKYLHIECHLAAKTGTNLAVSDLVGAILDDVFL